MYRSVFILISLSNIFGCSTPESHSSPISECLFLHTADTQPTYKGQRSPSSAHLYDDQISIYNDDSPTCELRSSGYPVDVVWLYPFHLQKLIFIEESALGTKLNLVDINKCEIIDDRQVRDYRVEKMRVLGTPDGCESGGVDCEAFTLFDVNHFCE